MRRWWLRYGSWWVGAILLLYATAILVEWAVTRAWVVSGKFNQPLDIFTSVCTSLAILLAALCWIFAAYRASAEISGVLSGFAHPRENEVRRARLALCFAQGVAIIAAVGLLNALVQLQGIHLQGLMDTARQHGTLPTNYLWTLVTVAHGALRSIWPIPFCMLWVCALLVAAPKWPYFALPWSLPALVPQALEFAMFADSERAIAVGKPGLLHNIGQLPYLHIAVLWVAGYILGLLLIWSIVSERRLLFRALYPLLVAAVIAYIPNWFFVPVNANPRPSDPAVMTANVLGALTAQSLTAPFDFITPERWTHQDRAGNISDRMPPTQGTLYIRSAYFGVVKDLPNWWAMLALLGNLAWLIAQYFILSALLGWRVRWTTSDYAAASP